MEILHFNTVEKRGMRGISVKSEMMEAAPNLPAADKQRGIIHQEPTHAHAHTHAHTHTLIHLSSGSYSGMDLD